MGMRKKFLLRHFVLFFSLREGEGAHKVAEWKSKQ